MSGHTPGPLMETGQCDVSGWVDLAAKDTTGPRGNMPVASVRPHAARPDTDELAVVRANAARLLLCWNSHDALVEALREAMSALDYLVEGEELSADDGGVCDNLCGNRLCDTVGCVRMKQAAARAALASATDSKAGQS